MRIMNTEQKKGTNGILRGITCWVGPGVRLRFSGKHSSPEYCDPLFSTTRFPVESWYCCSVGTRNGGDPGLEF